MQTAEGALGETNSMLQRMRELAVQASNDSLTSNDRQYIQLEINELRDQINRIADTTQFNKKRLLNGSSGAVWAGSDLNVKARINGGLSYIDQFGQKVSSEGNYRIDVQAEAGVAQVQKSNIINVAKTVHLVHEININSGLDNSPEIKSEGEGWKFENGLLTISKNGTYNIVGTGETTTNRIIVNSDVEADIFLTNVNIEPDRSSAFLIWDSAKVNLYLEGNNYMNTERMGGTAIHVRNATLNIANAAKNEGSLQVTGGKYGAGIGGYNQSTAGAEGNITIWGGNIFAKGGDFAAGIGNGGIGGKPYNIKIFDGTIKAFGGVFGAGIGGGDLGSGGTITIAGGLVTATGGELAAAIGGGSEGNSGTIKINQGLYKPDNTGQVKAYLDDIVDFDSPAIPIGHGNWGINTDVDLNANIEPESPPEVPDKPFIEIVNEKTLGKISQFYNPSGTFLVSQPQTITITQGDGRTASITLYETDTMQDAAKKINDAIANSLGQAKYADNPNKFCTLSDGTENTSESVYSRNPIYSDEIYKRDENGEFVLDENGNRITLSLEERLEGYEIYSTMLVRSVVPGKAGELYFSGDEDLLKALGLNTIQESQETRYTASVYDAHSGRPIVTNVKATSPYFENLIAPNVDIELDSMAGLKASWNEDTKRYIISDSDKYSAVIHLKDSGTAFQIGANKGEDFMIQLGDCSCDALGVSSINVLTRETASRAISTIDNAINKISAQRAKIGAYENALEHTMENLTTTTLNLTSAESRIRDADMSQEMMNLVKLQILNQSGTSMLAQANQLPQSVLSLLQ